MYEETIAGTTTRKQWILNPDSAGGLGFEREEVWVNGVMTRHEIRHYVSVGGAAIAVVKTLSATTALSNTVSTDANLILYWHKDSQGSVVAISNGAGNVMERVAFDAWRRRLDASNGRPDTSPNGPAHGDRGYTGHEHLDEIGLIHMNGRVYDLYSTEIVYKIRLDEQGRVIRLETNIFNEGE